MSPTPNTVIAYAGPSQLDRSPIMLLVTGLRSKSTNSKTGGMVQTYILRSDQSPLDALRSGADKSICGGCPLRPERKARKEGRIKRACYVQVGQAPQGMYKAYKRGRYTVVDPADLQHQLAGRKVRLGAYGDPAAIPITVWDTLLSQVLGWTGYTHQWRSRKFQEYKRYCQASVEQEEDLHDAREAGWGTFRVVAPGTERLAFEFSCPASAEQGHRTTCEQCMQCDGSSGAHVTIEAHGTGSRNLPVLTGIGVLEGSR